MIKTFDDERQMKYLQEVFTRVILLQMPNLNISAEKVLRNVLELQFKLEVHGICWSQSLPKVVSCFGEVYWLWQTGARIICQLLHQHLLNNCRRRLKQIRDSLLFRLCNYPGC